MDIHEATSRYEQWLGARVPIVGRDLDRKHELMSDPRVVFPFLRATYYRWVQRFPKICPELDRTPKVLAVGDLHASNFGVWREAEGRLAWGVNDFDEACVTAYAGDLVRLGASLLLASRDKELSIKPRVACRAVLDGYREGIAVALSRRAKPFVLGCEHLWLTELADERKTVAFWARFRANLGAPVKAVPREAAAALEACRPPGCAAWRFYARVAGTGSLGRPRFCALSELHGGPVAREAKGIVPSAMSWKKGKAVNAAAVYLKITTNAVRAPDPFLWIGDRWIVRRLAPDSHKIELAAARESGELERLCTAMGRETANVHAGTGPVLREIARDLKRRGRSWLIEAARAMAKDVRADWRDWRTRHR